MTGLGGNAEICRRVTCTSAPPLDTIAPERSKASNSLAPWDLMAEAMVGTSASGTHRVQPPSALLESP